MFIFRNSHTSVFVIFMNNCRIFLFLIMWDIVTLHIFCTISFQRSEYNGDLGFSKPGFEPYQGHILSRDKIEAQ